MITDKRNRAVSVKGTQTKGGAIKPGVASKIISTPSATVVRTANKRPKSSASSTGGVGKVAKSKAKPYKPANSVRSTSTTGTSGATSKKKLY